MIKIVAIIVTALITATLLKKTNAVFSLFITVAAALLIFFLVADDFADISRLFKDIATKVDGDNKYFAALIKILGISLVSQFVINICNDCGESALASQAELAAKIIIIVTVLPVFEAIIRIATGLLK